LEELGLTHERNVDVLLRRLVGGNEIGSLKLLASIVEPVKEYRRGQQRPSTMLSPLTGLVDAARPDSEHARRFKRMVDNFLSDAPRFELNASDLRLMLSAWRDSKPQLNAIVDRSPALREAQPLVTDLANLGDAGLEALSFLTMNQQPPADWKAAKFAQLDEAAKPKGALEFPVVTSVKTLVVAATELAHLRDISAAEWKKRVVSLASDVK
jgi:hexosaminidase